MGFGEVLEVGEWSVREKMGVGETTDFEEVGEAGGCEVDVGV